LFLWYYHDYIVFRHQNVGESHNLLIADKSFENMAKFKYRIRQRTTVFRCKYSVWINYFGFI